MNKQAGVLLKLINDDRWIQYIALELAEMVKPKETTDVTRLRKKANSRHGILLTKEQVDEMFKEFQRLGWGKYHVASGSGDACRMTWSPSFNPKAVATEALQGRSSKRTETAVAKVSREPDASDELTLPITLGSGRSLVLTLDEARELKAKLSKL